MEQSQILHQLKKLLLLYCYIVILLGFWLIWKNPVFAGVYPPCVVDGDCLGDENCVNCSEDCPPPCPIPPGSSASPLPSASVPPGETYLWCGDACCPGAPSPCEAAYSYDLYCWPACDNNAQVCYRDPTCYQPCRNCEFCGCGEAPNIGPVPSCADLDLCGDNYCDYETGQCHSVCSPCGGSSPSPSPIPSPASRPNIVSLYHVVGGGEQGEISLGTPVHYQATYEDGSIVSKPTDSLVSNGSFESGSSGWWGCSGPADCSIEAGGSIYGNHSLRLSRDSSGDAYYVSDWIDAGFELRSQDATFSFEVSTPIGNNIIYDIALQTYPTGGDWNNSKYLSRGSQTPTSTNWRRQIFQLTFPSSVPSGENSFRIVFRPPDQMNVDAYFDGIVVEQGHTAGLYTDIFGAQFSLEKDTDHNNLIKNGSFESGNTGWYTWPSSIPTGGNVVSGGNFGNQSFRVITKPYSTTNVASVTQYINSGFAPGEEMTASFWYKTGFDIDTVYLKVNYLLSDGYRNSWWNPVGGSTSSTWKHLSKTFTVPANTVRLEVEFQVFSASADKYGYVDGVLLETGNTEGYFMSLTEWPFRALFKPDEGFRLRDPQTNTWSSAAPALYDENNLVWYLNNNISVSDATLLGKDGEGNPRTFVRVDDDDLIVNWQFQLEDNFPIKAEEQDFWYTTLFVRDEAGQDDNFRDFGLEMFNINGWNYHRIEPVNIAQVGTVNGYVWYDVDGDGVKDGSENYLPNINVTVTGYGSDNTDSGGNYSIPDVIAGNRTVTVTPTANWECTAGCSQSVVVPSGGTVTANFGIRPYRGAITGNVYRNDICECSGTTASPDQTWVVTCSGDGIDGVLNGDTDSYPAEKTSNSNYRCVNTSGDSLLPYSNYTVLFTSASSGWTRVLSCGTSRNPVVLNASSVSAAPPFYQCQPAEPWWQSVGGNIHGQKEVKSNVPNGQALISGTNAIVSYVDDLDVFSGDISTSGWAAQSEYDGPDYTYAWWVRQLKDEDKVNGSTNLNDYAQDGVYELSPGSQLSGNLASARKVVILANGNVTINADIDVPVGSFLMMMASGTITVNDSLGVNASDPVLEGIFMADKINFGSSSTALFAAGNFIAWSNASDSITINRDIGGVLSTTTPSVTFISRPDLLLNAPDFVKKIDYTWQQVPG